MDIRYEKIIDLLYHSTVEQGGDGDAAWLIKYKELSPLNEVAIWLEQYNITHNTGWSVELKDDNILWGTNQEWVNIFTSKERFDKIPSWYSLKIIG